MKIFGPVPSRRLGRSVGINNIPPKHCTYSCVYCQVGCTEKYQIERKSFYEPEEILKEILKKVEILRKNRDPVDYLTFVADGEPSLDINTGYLIKELKKSDIKIALITNSSLLWREDVRKELEKADLISVKIDALEDEIWQKINRPSSFLKLNTILNGIIDFKKSFPGELITETMLIKNINDSEGHINKIGEYLEELRPLKAYISIPTRPPTEKWVEVPDEKLLNNSYQILSKYIENIEYLTGYEGNAFSFTGDLERDLLSITSVHPMKEKAVKELLKKADARWDIIQNLIKKNQISEIFYKGEKFYLRKFSSQK